jgi:hypothetical protein
MNLAKLEIKSFSDNLFSKDKGKKDFVLPVNPESFTKNYKVEHDTGKGQGNNQTNPKFIATAPEELKIEFILDGTGTIEGYLDALKNMPVKDQLEKFMECVYNYDGKIHRSRFLKVFYGSELNFPCVLSNLDINHTLFYADGAPLRVKISATFLKYVAPEVRVKKDRNGSPDLTHKRIIKQGDRLDLLSYDIYNSPNYLLQLGKVNGLTSIRDIPVGRELSFPPFSKEEN